MQHLIGKNDPDIFSAAKENQYFDRKSARKDTKEDGELLFKRSHL